MDPSVEADIAQAIAKAGLRRADFVISGKDTTPYVPNAVTHISGTATVTYAPTNKTKEYATGHGTTWPAELCQDLTAGLFTR